MPMRVIACHRIEALAERFGEVIAEVHTDPMAPEVVLVHSRGMGTWLTQQVARTYGVCANVRFAYPKSFIPEIITSCLNVNPEDTVARWRPEALVWRLIDVLPTIAADEASVARYLDDDADGMKTYQLARRVAAIYDRMQSYRHAQVQTWSQGQDDSWLARCWRAIEAEAGSQHLPALAGRLLHRAERGALTLPAGFPSRLTVFGISTMAPLHLDILTALADVIPVTFFLLSPTPHYWADIRSQREQGRRAGSAGEVDLHFDEGHSLLAGLGRVGREFQELLLARTDISLLPVEEQVAGANGMLGELQRQIRELDQPLQAQLVTRDDGISIHACHSPMRQVEALKDQLLSRFSRAPDLAPHDVVVMTPDIETYAPLIDAVFGARGGEGEPIPYRIADRSLRGENPVAHALLALLTSLGSRYPASEMLDLLALPPVAARLALTTEGLERIATWVKESGIRWGLDEAHRLRAGQPAYRANTWAFGLDRLLLGLAMPSEGKRLFGAVLPYDEVEGKEALALGELARFVSELAALEEELAAPREVARWETDLLGVLDRMLATSPADAWQLQQVRDVLGELRAHAVSADARAPISREVMTEVLTRALEDTRSPHGFLSGGVTFCAMLPMRSVPFSLVAMLGMDETRFPRADRELPFDTIAQHPRPGDRSRRSDDRYLFLEALLSARRALMIFYTGFERKDQRELPPSVVVSELSDALDRAFRFEDGVKPSEAILSAHPIQPFSPLNYRPGTVTQSHDRVFLEGARAHERAHVPPPRFVDAAREVSEPDVDISPEELVRFFGNPFRGYLKALGLRDPDRVDATHDREPIAPVGLELYGINDLTLQALLDGASDAEIRTRLMGEGLLPYGALGEGVFSRARAAMGEIWLAARDALPTTRLEVTRVPGLAGTLTQVGERGALVVRAKRVSAAGRLELWVRHLIVSAQRAEACRSRLYGRPDGDGNGACGFGPIADPQAQLSELITLYRTGHERPLLLIPELSEAWSRMWDGTPSGEEAATKASWKVWRGRPGPSGPRLFERWENRQILHGSPPFTANFRLLPDDDGAFRDVASRVYGPLLAHLDTA